MVEAHPATWYLIRHGESEGNVRTDLWEWTDCSLTPRGQAQMEHLADRLRGQPLDIIYASTMRRARQSAEILEAATHVPVTYVDWLREMDFGDLDLMTMDEIRLKHPGLLEGFVSSWDDTFPHGDSLRTFYDRVTSGVKCLLDDPARPPHVALLGHGGSLDVTLNYILDLPLIPLERFEIANGSLSILRYRRVGSAMRWVLALHNDTCHWRLAGV